MIGRRTYGAMLARMALALALIAALCLGAWTYARAWAPDRADYPVQGVTVDAAMGVIDWPTVRARHADFAYVHATRGAKHRDARFAANWSGAQKSGLRYGAVHDFSLCDRAFDQATLFLSTVPRDNAALPAVVRLSFDPSCAARPSRDALLSALNIFLNLIEGHSGKPAVLRIGETFEAQYRVSEGINRTLWLERNFITPDYATRPWVMWSATDMRRLDGVDGPVEWNVVAQ